MYLVCERTFGKINVLTYWQRYRRYVSDNLSYVICFHESTYSNLFDCKNEIYLCTYL